MIWKMSDRFDPPAVALADRHYNRQKIGTPQFMPPGSCLVLLTEDESNVWGTSWPEHSRHQWAGAWVNTIFRKETSNFLASDAIRQAVAATRWFYGDPPSRGMITFIDKNAVRPTRVHGENVWGWSYLKAGFRLVGTTKIHGRLVFQLLPDDMPLPEPPINAQLCFFIPSAIREGRSVTNVTCKLTSGGVH